MKSQRISSYKYWRTPMSDDTLALAKIVGVMEEPKPSHKLDQALTAILFALVIANSLAFAIMTGNIEACQ
ncbi:gp85 [Corynebacterium phage P1201]|uniref:Gp85 n=1 Tax=Corynebacterium phage P1201 TaxID=384848 RepID=A7IYF2_9CAUD|nr:gp85 [Corynebacterium phage P1201]ABF57535.1 gp85 [Corynebacterium phage P1201]